MNPPLVAVTTGEPAGVGPELCMRVAAGCSLPLVLIGDRDLLRERAMACGIPSSIPDHDPAVPSGLPTILHVPLAVPSAAGQPDARNADYVLATLDRAIDGCTSGEFCAMVTAPVQKSVIAEGGHDFMGHTEYLAERCGVDRVVMMLVGGGMRVALATTHLALRDVPDAIKQPSLEETIRILHADLKSKFGIARPRILVAGLNPHAGEAGRFGREEIEVIEPVIRAMQRRGFDVTGPLPADTLFQSRYLDRADAVLAMYHDQGLAVLKYASFGRGVNVTLGLPIVRTSVDHGTALDLAGTGKADDGSLRAAVELACALAGVGREGFSDDR
ncbi:MAG: 4-hydroxythreonine-4-phosphate dehydrogenase PdxA [Betaproteobacteria bacterium]|nr:4-hydroxythreonine-4-phosphate dehydrogenase PdxA [Betaproteobacteria bacterium]